MILVDATGLAVARPGKPLFTDLAVTVASGDRLGVVGINGYGKSTLLQVLAGTRDVSPWCREQLAQLPDDPATAPAASQEGLPPAVRTGVVP